MTISIHQPNFLPYLGYFYKIYKSDIFVILDDVKYIKREFMSRSKIKTNNGKKWIRIPVHQKTNQLINEVQISDYRFNIRKTLNTIRHNYSKSPNFAEIFSELEEIFEVEYSSLMDLNCKLIRWALHKMGIWREIRVSSMLEKIEGVSTKRIVSIVKSLSGTEYYTGSGAKCYQDEALFRRSGIKLVESDFASKFNKYFDLSIIDIFFNHGTKILFR